MSTFKGFGTPPASNTGVRCVEVHVDYLSCSFPAKHVPQLQYLVEQFTGHSFITDEPFPTRWYKVCYRNLFGTTLYTEPNAAHSDRCLITFPSSALAAFTLETQKKIFEFLASIDGRCTRIDPCIDDFTKTVTPDLVRETVNRGNQTGFRLSPYTKWMESGKAGDVQSSTYYIGRRGKNGSGKYVRCYTKYLESCGVIDSTRFEVEMTEHYSVNLFDILAKAETNMWSKILIASIVGAIDFIDRSFSDVLPECPRLEWWEKIVGDDAPIKVSKSRKLKSITKSINWINKQVLPTLSIVLDYAVEMKQDVELYFWELYFRGAERQTDFQKQMLFQSLSLET